MDFLRVDGPFASTIYKLANMILVSAMWVIFCIPVFTAGASTTALYYTVQKSLKNDRGNTWTCFWDSFKSNFKQSTIPHLIFLAATFIFVSDIQIIGWLRADGVTPGYMRNFFIVIIVIVWIYAVWVYFYIARFESTFKETMMNAGALAVVHFPYTIGMAAIAAFSIFIVYLVWPLIFIMPAVGVWLMSMLSEKVFRRYMTEDAKELEDELNMNWNDEYAGKGRDQKKKNRK